jgi:hypothetical protein
MKFEMKVEPKFFYAKLSGEFSLKEAKAAFLALMDAVAENRCKKVLVDGREVTGDIRVIERFSMANSWRLQFANTCSTDPSATRSSHMYLNRPYWIRKSSGRPWQRIGA